MALIGPVERSFLKRLWNGETCCYGFPNPCGAPADYECYGKHFPLPMPGCESHARYLHSSGRPIRLIRPESTEFPDSTVTGIQLGYKHVWM